jgi:hypothetical protein
MFGGHFAGNVFSNGAAPGVLRQAGASPRNRCYEPAGTQPVAREVFRPGPLDHDLVISGL